MKFLYFHVNATISIRSKEIVQVPLVMLIEQKKWTIANQWSQESDGKLDGEADLVLCFGGRSVVDEKERFAEVREFYPSARIVMCSTAGEILDDKLSEDSISLTAIRFHTTKVSAISTIVEKTEDTFEAGKEIIERLDEDDLAYLMIISDGHVVNGSELVASIGRNARDGVIVTGGLAGDGPNFSSTVVGLDDVPTEGNIVGIGFYGSKLSIGHAAKGGWEPFGPERLITKSKSNLLYELDDQSALDLYKKYLGELSEDLPSSALLFPLSIKLPGEDVPLVRTVLGIDEENKSMIFAGDMPEGSIARMMRSDFVKLVDAAGVASRTAIQDFGSFIPDLAVVISCAGRKFALQERVVEELEQVRDVLGDNTAISGFYSYGEISPVVSSTKCELHNQTMTITTFREEVDG